VDHKLVHPGQGWISHEMKMALSACDDLRNECDGNSVFGMRLEVSRDLTRIETACRAVLRAVTDKLPE